MNHNRRVGFSSPTTNSSMAAFSLVEALLAMTILGIAVAGILTTFSSALIAGKVAEDYALVSNLMGDLRSRLRSNMMLPNQTNSGFFDEYSNFFWQVNFYTTDLDNLYQAELVIQWKRGNRNYEVHQSTYHYYQTSQEGTATGSSTGGSSRSSGRSSQ